MIKKIIAALLTGFLIVLMLVVIIGIIINASYSFVFQFAFWLGTSKRTVIFILLIASLIISLITFAAIADKD